MITRLIAASIGAAILACTSAGSACANPSEIPNSSFALRPAPVAAPAGAYPVGRTEVALTGSDRVVMVSVWYPTTVTATAAYIPVTDPLATAQIAETAAQWLHTPSAAATMAAGAAPAAENAAADISLGRLPVVVMSPGLGTPRFILSGLAGELASRGYVVVVMDHTGESPAVQLPGGRIVVGADVRPGDAGYMRSRLAERLTDTRLTLDRLPTLPVVGPMLDLDRIAMVGHSYGGLTAVQLAATDTRIRAVVVLDGSAGWDGAADAPTLDRPVLLLASGQTPLHPSWARFHDRGFEQATLTDAGHYAATDLCGLGGDSVRCGTIAAGRATTVCRGVVTGWLERQLRGGDDAQFEAPELAWK